mgnify:CR=1 FL=1
MAPLRTLMARRHALVVTLRRQNRIKQALSEYRRLHLGLGQFSAANGLLRAASERSRRRCAVRCSSKSRGSTVRLPHSRARSCG